MHHQTKEFIRMNKEARKKARAKGNHKESKEKNGMLFT